MGIVHVLEKNRTVTGSVVQMLDAAAGLADRGHRVTVASRPGGDLEGRCDDAGIGFVALPLRGVADPRSVRTLRRVLRLAGTEILHVHKGRAHSAALLAAAGLGVWPRIVVNRGVTFPLDAFNRWKYRHPRIAAVVCVADAVREVVIRTAGVAADRVTVIHSGTDVDVFDPDRVSGRAVRRSLGIEGGDVVVGHVSIRDWKGWREVLTAFARAAATRPRLRLVIAACEPADARRRVETAVRQLALGDRVHLLGERHDMPHVLAACDIVTDGSWAGTGITGTVREAMALERAVVATDCGGNRELVADGTGLLVPARDVGALADAIGRLADDEVLRARLGRAARPRVEHAFSTARRVDRLETLYAHIVRRATADRACEEGAR
jgi:glycosyltransferase involved in cell wall biosynthesis